MNRKIARFAIGATLLLALPNFAFAAEQQPAAPAAPSAAPTAAPAAAPAGDPNAQQFSINQNVGSWIVRCIQTTVKSPAPCEVMQFTVNKDTNQRISNFSIAFIPSRDNYAMQIVVPTGIALAKGLSIGKILTGAKYTRCERDGCYVETLVDNAAITAITAAGKDSGGILVYGYGQDKEQALPLDLTGFPEAMDRMKSFARERAVALPANSSALPAAPPSVGPAPAAAPAAARPAAPAAARPAAGRAGAAR